MNQEEGSIKLRSEEIRDMIAYKPHWMVQWSLSVFFLILLLILAASWMIHYPEMVKAPFRLTSVNAPKPILAKVDGKIVRLLVQDQTRVKTGQLLAFLESTADHTQVLALCDQVEGLAQQVENRSKAASLSFTSLPHLGELQTSYEVFQQAYRQYVSLGKNGYYSQREALLGKELTDLSGLENTLLNQLHIQEQDQQIAQEEYALQQELARQKVIAPMELKREKSKYLAKQLPVQQTLASLFENRSVQSVKRKELLELKRIMDEGQSIFVQSLNTLRSVLTAWKNRYLLVAPIDGIVVYASLLEEKQTVSTHQELFYINPDSKDYYGEVLIPQNNSGKVKVGQKVLIKFAGYPYAEFGQVEGELVYLSAIPTHQNTFLAKVSLPKGLLTHYQKKITYKAGMSATAEIITEDTRLMEVFIFNFRKAVAR